MIDRYRLLLIELGRVVSRVTPAHVRIATTVLVALVVGIGVLAITWEWKPALGAAIVANLLDLSLGSLMRRFRAT
jgi:hypothetical protein